MPLVSLTPVLAAARARGGAALGLVCLGWEDAQAYVAAGEATGVPVILQAGPGARAHMPIEVWGEMFRWLAARAEVPVVAHLDHGASVAEVEGALAAGFSSVMYDGSRLPLAENIAQSLEAAALARAAGASFEAEVGFVGYAEGAGSQPTCPQEAARFCEAVQPDCLAVSVGNVHLMTGDPTPLDWAALKAVRTALSQPLMQPLVLHGGSGVPPAHRARAARDFGVAKINLGTELRQVYGAALRDSLAEQPDVFDRLKLQAPVTAALQAATQEVLVQAWGQAGGRGVDTA